MEIPVDAGCRRLAQGPPDRSAGPMLVAASGPGEPMTGTYRYPFTSTPDGWYHVAASEEVEAGQVRSLHFFGRDLVLFRTESGKAVVLTAYLAIVARVDFRAHASCIAAEKTK